MPGRARRAGLLLAAGAVVLAGCSSGDGDAGSTADTGTAGASSDAPAGDAQATDVGIGAQPESVDGVRAQTTAGAAAGSGPTLDVGEAAFAGREVIRTGSLSLRARDLTAARERVAGLVDRLGGVVASESTSLDPAPGKRRSGSQWVLLGLQVPTERFDAAMTELSELGRVQERSIQTEDVTGEVADVDSRVDSARAALERVRALLTRADSLGTVIRLEGVLSDRQADLEALLSQQRALAGQTSLATIQVELRTAAPRPEPVAEDEEVRGFLAGLGAGWDGLRTLLTSVGTGVGVALPFLLLGAALGAPALVWHRRRRDGDTASALNPPAT